MLLSNCRGFSSAAKVAAWQAQGLEFGPGTKKKSWVTEGGKDPPSVYKWVRKQIDFCLESTWGPVSMFQSDSSDIRVGVDIANTFSVFICYFCYWLNQERESVLFSRGFHKYFWFVRENDHFVRMHPILQNNYVYLYISPCSCFLDTCHFKFLLHNIK